MKVGECIVRFRVLEILEEKGKTKYWLNKQLQMHSMYFKDMIDGRTVSVHFKTIEQLSKIVEVPIGELFEIVSDDEKA